MTASMRRWTRWVAAIMGVFLVWFFGIDLIRVRPFSPPPGDPGRFVRVDGAKVYYRVEGSGPAVLLLHGTGASSYSWRHNIATLAQHFTVYAPDMPGYGYSDKPGGQYSAGRLAEWASHFLQVVGVKRAAVVGHSLGGEVGLRLALAHPEQVDRLLVVDAAGTGPLTGSFKMVAVPVVGEIMMKATGKGMLRSLMRQAYVQKEAVTDEMVSLYNRFNWSPGARNAFLSRLRVYHQDSEFLKPRLRELQVPVLAVWGAQDPYFPLDVARGMVDQIPGGELVIFDQTGHVPHEEQPERFNDLALGWLAGPRPAQ